MFRALFSLSILCLLANTFSVAVPINDGDGLVADLKDTVASNALFDTEEKDSDVPATSNEAQGQVNDENIKNDDKDAISDDDGQDNKHSDDTGTSPVNTDTSKAKAIKDKDSTSILANSLNGFITVKNSVLQNHINSLIRSHFRNEPVTKMLMFSVTGSRAITISHINGNNFAVGRAVASLSIRNHASPSKNTILAYRPDYSAYHGSRHAAIFINMERVFPCIRRITSLGPICKMYTNEEDGFNNALTMIEAGDSGNNLKIFGSNKSTYGFGFKTCRVLDKYCLPTHYQSTIVCQLPRAYCR